MRRGGVEEAKLPLPPKSYATGRPTPGTLPAFYSSFLTPRRAVVDARAGGPRSRRTGCGTASTDGLGDQGTLRERVGSPGRGSSISQEQSAGRDVTWTRLGRPPRAGARRRRRGVLRNVHDYGGERRHRPRRPGPNLPPGPRPRARVTNRAAGWQQERAGDAPATRELPLRGGRRSKGPLHLDISTYASTIPGVPDGGSVCRGAHGRVVNIVGGGEGSRRSS